MICSNPACTHAGIDQPPENFHKGKKKCKDCCNSWGKEWYKRNGESQKAYRKRIPDDDPEDDLKPVQGNGDWIRITR